LQDRYELYLNGLIELAEKEIHRTRWERSCHELARMYRERFMANRATYLAWGRDLVGAFRQFQELGKLEIITTAATHALLPLLAEHPPSLRAQILVARDHYRDCFGGEPRGFWLPECAYVEKVEPVLQEANIRWFVVDAPGLSRARPRPRYGVFAPVFTPNGIAAFGRDLDSARQVWSRHEGYPGDPRYRDFYRDVGFDLDFEYVRPHLPSPAHRGATGIKYHCVSGDTTEKRLYDRRAAVQAAAQHAEHFLQAHAEQISRLAAAMRRPALVVAPFDAELFGHWWFEGPDFLDFLVRKAARDQSALKLVTPHEYLQENPTQQIAAPCPSSWLDEVNEWIYPHLHFAQRRMTELVRRFRNAGTLETRALKQAARELLLAQASDWPFILRAGTSPQYARKRVTQHLLRCTTLLDQLATRAVDARRLSELERQDSIFPEIDYRYYQPGSR
jgi:1,4-alpha-glucan branching enzyme